MTRRVLDVVAVLPAELHARSLLLSTELADRMAANGDNRSHFRLGQPFDHSGGPCEPHVSVFMLTVDDAEIDDVVQATRAAAASLPPMRAEGERYAHNPVGAPELYFRKNAEWVALQTAVIAAVEPLRKGRLRELDPAGARIADILADPDEDAARRDQLTRFGYDEITEQWGSEPDRFNPHVTLAWPTDPDSRVDLADLAPAPEFSGPLADLAVYGMSPNGTCTTLYGTAPLGVPSTADAR